MNRLGLKHLEFSGLQMKTIIKALLLLIGLSAVPVFAQSDFESTKARAEAGDAQAQWSLGEMYDTGEGVVQDDVEAAKWHRLAAEQGNANSQFILGATYKDGEGVAQNYQEAVKWYRLAAEQGDALAQFFLGAMYGDGRGVTQSYAKAYVVLIFVITLTSEY
jgi:TPR repeat protein